MLQNTGRRANNAIASAGGVGVGGSGVGAGVQFGANPKAALRSVQIIAAVFIAGVLTFMGVVVAMTLMKAGSLPAGGGGGAGGGAGSGAGSVTTPGPFLIYVAIGLMVMAVIFAAVVRPVSVRMARGGWAQRTDDDAAIAGLAQRFSQMSVLRMAMLEGAALLCTAVLHIEQQWLALAPWGVGLVGLVVLFPTSKRLEKFLADVTGREGGAA